MKISSYSSIGKRTNNEDFFNFSDHLFIVCDGVGGEEKGEVASQFIVDNLIKRIVDSEKLLNNESSIQQLITDVQNQLNLRLIENPDEIGMGTTLTFLYNSLNSVFIAHIGDSRVYYIKPQLNKYWRTIDHSFVQELVNAGVITEEAARTHPKKNHITKAIQANNENKIAKADIVKLNEIETGDLFFLCTDGVNETWDDFPLIELLCRLDLSVDEKIEIVKEKCQFSSKDNNTAILIQVEEKDAFSSGSNDHLQFSNLDMNCDLDISELDINDNSINDHCSVEFNKDGTEDQNSNATHKNLSSFNWHKRILKWIFFLLIVVIGFTYLYNQMSSKNETKKQNQQSQQKLKTKNNTLDQKKWKEVENSNSIIKYEEYLREYPNGTQKVSAQKKILILKDEEAWIQAKNEDNTLSYKKYMKEFPKGKYSEEANKCIIGIENKIKNKVPNRVQKIFDNKIEIQDSVSIKNEINKQDTL